MNRLELTEESKAALSANKEFTDKWVAGLRSGKYTQIKNKMTAQDIPNSACCLMVMEMECNNRSRESVPDDASVPSELAKPYTLTLTSVPDHLLLPENIEAVVWVSQTTTIFKPSAWNDVLELSFEQIATLLETGELEYEH